MAFMAIRTVVAGLPLNVSMSLNTSSARTGPFKPSWESGEDAAGVGVAAAFWATARFSETAIVKIIRRTADSVPFMWTSCPQTLIFLVIAFLRLDNRINVNGKSNQRSAVSGQPKL